MPTGQFCSYGLRDAQVGLPNTARLCRNARPTGTLEPGGRLAHESLRIKRASFSVSCKYQRKNEAPRAEGLTCDAG